MASEHLYNITNIGLTIHSGMLCDISKKRLHDLGLAWIDAGNQNEIRWAKSLMQLALFSDGKPHAQQQTPHKQSIARHAGTPEVYA